MPSKIEFYNPRLSNFYKTRDGRYVVIEARLPQGYKGRLLTDNPLTNRSIGWLMEVLYDLDGLSFEQPELDLVEGVLPKAT